MSTLKATLTLSLSLSAALWSANVSAAPSFVGRPDIQATRNPIVRVHATDGSELLWQPRDNLRGSWVTGRADGDPNSFERVYERATVFHDEISELRLGLKYYKGEGVKQDFAAAAKWLRLSAQQGNHTAQAVLGYQYYSGAGVPRDLVEAHLWVTLALETLPQGKARASVKSLLASIQRELTPEQRSAAEQRLREWNSGMSALE
ncbi:MAG TPA: tetratricopeptide repeat protein [Alphaproteobacteria bacterium]|nr:tetratricopeptide repeat protein [Alphaproteobacteria bacterium]